MKKKSFQRRIGPDPPFLPLIVALQFRWILRSFGEIWKGSVIVKGPGKNSGHGLLKNGMMGADGGWQGAKPGCFQLSASDLNCLQLWEVYTPDRWVNWNCSCCDDQSYISLMQCWQNILSLNLDISWLQVHNDRISANSMWYRWSWYLIYNKNSIKCQICFDCSTRKLLKYLCVIWLVYRT